MNATVRPESRPDPTVSRGGRRGARPFFCPRGHDPGLSTADPGPASTPMSESRDDPIWLCPHCGTANEADLDSFARGEEVVVDCTICCRPSRLRMIDEGGDGRRVVAFEA